jgi:nucleotide-binding universal stress UspA family protein
MSRVSTVLAAVELHDDAVDVVVDTAGMLAAALGTEVVVAGIAPLALPAPGAGDAVVPLRPADTVDLQTAIDGLTQHRVQQAAARLPAGVARRTVLCWAPAGRAIVEASRRERAGLVVVAMRRGSAMGHLLHDATDRFVLHHSDVPVLVVPVGPHDSDGEHDDATTGAAA